MQKGEEGIQLQVQFKNKYSEKAKQKGSKQEGVVVFSKKEVREKQKFHEPWNQPGKCGFPCRCVSQDCIICGFSDA